MVDFLKVALTDDRTDRVRILNSYFRDIVGLDIAEAAHEVPGTAELFGKYALQSPYFSASKCLNFFTSLGYRVGKERLLHLEQYAKSRVSLLVFTHFFVFFPGLVAVSKEGVLHRSWFLLCDDRENRLGEAL